MKHSSLPVHARRGKPGRGLEALVAGLFLLLVLCPPAFAAGVFKWTDEQGRVHYGDRPPAAADARPVEVAPAPGVTPGETARREKTGRLLDAIESERARKRSESRRARAEETQRQQNCDTARRRVALFGRANSVSRRDEDGQRVYLSDAERAEAMDAARALVRTWCN